MINLTVVIDNDEAVKKLKELQRVAKTTTSSVVEDSERMDTSFQKMGNTLAGFAAGVSFAAFSKQLVQVRGEVQQLEVAFETMLGSKERADRLVSEAMQFAAKTPFGLQDVSNGAKMLLAYGSAAEEVIGEIEMLGNIASGLSIPLNDLIYLYGTTRTQGQMFTQDLRQFMGRGIPLAEQLAEQFGVTKDRVSELVSAGRVGFEDMAKALQSMSGEGGQFYNLMEKQSQTIAGQMSNLEDSIYQMFNEIGEKSEGIISDSISVVSSLVDNYERVGRTLLGLVSIYGTYKAAVIAYTVISAAAANAAKGLALSEQILMLATIAAEKAQKILNATMLANPYVLVATAIAGLVAVLVSQKNATERLHEAEENYNNAKQETIANEEKHKRVIEDLVSIASNEASATNLRKDALHELIRQYPQVFANYETEAEMLKNIRDIKLEIEDIENGRSITNIDNELADVERQIEEFYSNYGISIWRSGLYDLFEDDERIRIKEMVSASESARITQLENRREELLRARKEEERNNYLLNAPSLSDAELDSEIERLKSVLDLRTLANTALQTPGGLSDAARYGVELFNTGMSGVSEEQLRAEITILEAEKAAREADTKSSSDWVAAKKKTYEDAKKAYEDYINNRGNDITDEEFTAEANRLNAIVEDAKKAYQQVGGVVLSSDASQRQNDAMAKRAKELATMAVKLQNDVDQAEIDAMSEGTAKKIAQIELDYRKRKQAIDVSKEDLEEKQGTPLTEEQLESYHDLYMSNEMQKSKSIQEVLDAELDERDEYLIRYGTARERELAITRKYDRLIAQAGENVWQVAMLQRQKEEDLSEDEEEWNDYLIKYGTFQEKVRATTEKYAREISNAQTEGERRTLEIERDVLLSQYEAEASEWASELVNKSTRRLNIMLEELQEQVRAKEAAFAALDSSDGELADSYRDEINKLKAQIIVLQKELDKAGRKAKDGRWTDAAQIFHEISSAANDTASGLEDVNESLANSLKTFSKLSSAAGSLVSAIGLVADASSALSAALGIIGLISAAINAVLTVINLAKDNYGVEETVNQFRDLNTEIERARNLAKIDSWEGTIFGEDAFGNFVNNLSVMNDATNALAKSQENIIARGKEVWKLLAENDSHIYVRGIDDYRYGSVDESISKMQVKTRDRSGFAEFFGAMDEYANLGDLMPTLFGEDGSVTLDGLKELRNSDVWEKLSEANRELIDNMIADWELYEESLEATNEYMQSIFGDLGASITDSLVDAFKNGTDAAIAMGDAVADVVEKIATDMAHAAFIQPLLAQAQEGINALNEQKSKGALSDEEYMRQLMEITSTLMGNAQATGEDMNAYLEYIRQQAAELGIDGVLDSDNKDTTHAKGFQAMSQETGSELNGRFTDIQGQTHRIAEAVEFCRGLQAQQAQHLQSVSSTLASIHNDTSLIAQHTKALGEIRDDISVMRRAMDNGII